MCVCVCVKENFETSTTSAGKKMIKRITKQFQQTNFVRVLVKAEVDVHQIFRFGSYGCSQILFRFSGAFCLQHLMISNIGNVTDFRLCICTKERATNMLSPLCAFDVQPICFSHSKKLNRAEMRVQLFSPFCIRSIAFLLFHSTHLQHFIHIHV